MSERMAEQSNGVGGSGSQEAPIHRQSASGGQAASVAQQEEDGVHHVLHLWRQVEAKSKDGGGFPCPSSPNQPPGPGKL